MTDPDPGGRTDAVAEQLVRWGRHLRLVTRGRSSGREVAAVVGFAAEPDGSLVVAAGDPGAGWARNLAAEPACTVTIAEETFGANAEELDGADRAAAIRELILKYGTPAERLGAGPAFRLRRV